MPFKVTPLRYNTLMPAFIPIPETLLKPAFWYPNSFCFDFSFIYSIVAKHLSLIGVFSFGKRKKLAEPKSGEFGCLS